MAASVFDSPLYAHLFPTGEAGRLFSDTAALRAMLLVLGALARSQAALGVIPDLSAKAIQRATMEIQIDPGAIARATGENGDCVEGLVAAFRAEMNAPEHAQFVHWGASSQDIMDTALMLRLRQLLLLAEQDLRTIIAALAQQASEHAQTPMTGRTNGQRLTPTSWGAVVADWGHALCDLVEALTVLRASSLYASLSGSAGTGSPLGPQAAQTRAGLATGLGLNDPARCWHVDRGPIQRIADWLGQVTNVLSRMGVSLIALTSPEIAEVRMLAFSRQQGPVGPAAMLALGHQMNGLRAALSAATHHAHQGDNAAFFTEWMVLPQIALGTASALQHAKIVTQNMKADTDRMAATLGDRHGIIHGEALTYALAREMPRPKAQAETARLCHAAQDQGVPLEKIARAAYPVLTQDLFDPARSLGQAPVDARAFAARAKAI
ncbi:lyase family protein [Sulfitobacter sp. F26169L]|uniref:lyase family protein n=1 Tax=Sulfitobacter sp. F26169L TaxID=2996015 RepID=UPI00226086CF|nr:lyase family protein [Sulfitobacter sp. F26169L]MCX7567059.1 lyase family protein [Sulfitobacter sp. F26169L]